MRGVLAARYVEVIAIAGFAIWFGWDRQPEPAVALLLAFAAYVVTEFRFLSLFEERRQSDLTTLADLQARLTPAVTEFLRSHQFADAFAELDVRPLRYFPADWKSPDRLFHDPQLEKELRSLVMAVEAFNATSAANTFTQGTGFFGVEKSWREGRRRAEFDQAVSALNEQAGQVAVVRDRLVAQGRKRLGS